VSLLCVKVLEAVSTPGGSRVGITGAQALALAVPNQMIRQYPGRVGIQTNLYQSVIANAAYPPKTPEKPLRYAILSCKWGMDSREAPSHSGGSLGGLK
jgi:hypothetical protein